MTVISPLTLFAAADRDGTNGLMTMGVIIGMVVLVVGLQIAGLIQHYRIPPAGCALVRDGRGGLVAVMVEHDMILTAATRLLALPAEDMILLVKDIILDEYERLLAQANDDASRDSPANRFTEGVEQAHNTIGLTIIACRCQ